MRKSSLRHSRVAGIASVAGALVLVLSVTDLAAQESGVAPGTLDELDEQASAQDRHLTALPADAWDLALSAAVLPDADIQPQSSIARAPAGELATGLNIQVQKKRRKFRARAVNWMADISPAAGTMTDFLLGGADSGWHLVLDPTGTDEYIIEWKARFR